MIKVYFETKHSAELIAVFESEEIYNLCVPALEQEAEKRGMTLTESVKGNIDLSEIIN